MPPRHGPRSLHHSYEQGQSLNRSNGKENRPRTLIDSIPKLKPGASASCQYLMPSNLSRRAEIVRWVAESLRPYEIMNDRAFQCLMKTGRPEYYIPSHYTVARDVKLVFAHMWNRISKMLRVRLLVLMRQKMELIDNRSMMDASVLRQMDGPHQIIVHFLLFLHTQHQVVSHFVYHQTSLKSPRQKFNIPCTFGHG